LAFGRSEPLELRARRLDATLREAAPMLERLLPENVAVHWRLAAGDACARLDDTLVSMAILNLVLNARDAMPEGGTLTIATDVIGLHADEVADDELLRPGEHLRCTVSDTGHGMDPEVLRNVRNPYFTTKERNRGTGLGLASVTGIVEQHGGALRLASTPGQGTTATILVPRCASAPEPSPRMAAGRRGPAPTVARVLLVEDVAAVADFVRRALVLDGHTVEMATSGEEVLARWDEIGPRIDLVISDVVLPGIDGPALCARLRFDQPDLRVLLMSGYDDRVVEQRGAPEDELPLLRKPFGIADLVTKVRACLAPVESV
jgi:CheY-like chemotaxis protein